jgi:Ca2+-binding RTX toxin-like protein
VVLDLNGNGFHFIDARDSKAFYDFSGDGVRERTGWLAGSDGLLAYDANSDGVISQRDEIRFKGYVAGARTDLEGLAAFDSNKDGQLSADDQQWSKFAVWQDANEDGEQTAGELRTLQQRGIASIQLHSDNVLRKVAGNTVYGIGTYSRIDGSSAKLADVRFALTTDQQDTDPTDDITTPQEGSNLSTGAGDDRIRGGGGMDVIRAGSGHDKVSGGAGEDRLFGDSGNDILAGDTGSDTLNGGMGDDALAGGADDDHLLGGLGNDRLFGDAGDDSLYGEDGNDTLAGGDGNDILKGGDGLDKLFGGSGHDWLHGGTGADRMQGDTGNDIYIVGNSFDEVIEQVADTGGSDTVITYVDLRGPRGVETIVIAGKGEIEVSAGAKSQIILGNEAANILDGGAGDDRMIGGGGDDIYVVDSENDVTLEYEDGWLPAGETSLFTTDHVLNERFFNLYGHDQFTGGSWGVDTVRSSVDWRLGPAIENLVLTGTKALTGTGNSQANQIRGNRGANHLEGGEGDDIIDGLGGDDWLDGGPGNDIYAFGRGSNQDTVLSYDATPNKKDVIRLDADILPSDIRLQRCTDDLLVLIRGSQDTLRLGNYFMADGSSPYSIEEIRFNDGTAWTFGRVKELLPTSSQDNDILYGYNMSDTIYGLAGDDKIHGRDGDDSLYGGKGKDDLYGEIGKDLIHGGEDDDRLDGGEGDDRLHGHAGNDILYGQGGDDYLHGGRGNDILIGGAGNDTYQFGRGSGQDIVDTYDQSPGKKDTIQLGLRLLPSSIKLQREGEDLILAIIGPGGHSLRVLNHFKDNGYSGHQIDQIRFGDGSLWDAGTVGTMLT